MKEIVKEKIASLLSGDEEIQSVEQLGGMTNQNYLVKTSSNQYIVKFFGKGTDKLIDRQNMLRHLIQLPLKPNLKRLLQFYKPFTLLVKN